MATATQKKKVHKVTHEHKKGTLKSDSCKKVRSREVCDARKRRGELCFRDNDRRHRRQAHSIG